MFHRAPGPCVRVRVSVSVSSVSVYPYRSWRAPPGNGEKPPEKLASVDGCSAQKYRRTLPVRPSAGNGESDAAASASPVFVESSACPPPVLTLAVYETVVVTWSTRFGTSERLPACVMLRENRPCSFWTTPALVFALAEMPS